MPVNSTWVNSGLQNRKAIRFAALLFLFVAISIALIQPGPRHSASANAASFSLNQLSFGANEQIRIEFGTLTRESSDFIWTFSSIYIVPAGSGSSGGTLNDVSGAPNSVMGISGSAIVDELIGITAPSGNIGTGTYVVIEDANQDGIFNGSDSIGPSFTVTVPANVPPLPNSPYAGMKANALDMEQKWRDTHSAYKALFDLADLIDIYGALTDPSDAAMYVVGQTLGGIYDVKKATLQTILSVAAQYKGIAADPPDPAFAQPTTLAPTSLFDFESDDPTQVALQLVGNNLAVEDSLAEALLAALERYQGAAVAGNGEWALAQARDVRRYADLLSISASATPAAATNLSAVLSSDPRDYDGKSLAMQALASSLGSSGFSESETRDLKNLGFTQGEIDDLATQIAGDSWAFNKANFQSLIGSTAAAYGDLQAALVELVDGMDTVIAALEVDPGVVGTIPTADAGGPYTGDEGTGINLDASASIPGPGGTPIVSYEWDTDGDGAFDDETGATPAVVFNQAFSGFVGVLVTDGNGNSAVDYALISIAEVNAPPSIDSSSPISSSLELIVGVNQPFSVTATDPDVDSVSVEWDLDGSSVAAGSSFDFTPALTDVGPHTLAARATDDSPLGGTTQQLWLIQVNASDGDSDLWNSNVDCDDSNPAINPGAAEIIGNSTNDDCDDATPDSGLPPIASFITNPLFGSPGVSAIFTSTSTDPDDAIVGYEWDFDNDGVSDATTGEASHTFVSTGSFPVTLTVTDSASNSDSVTQVFLVAEAPTAAFDVLSGPKVAGFPIGFADASTDPNGTVVTWEWDFGDGSSSSQKDPTHEFAETGIFKVELKVTDDEGAYDSTFQMVTIGALSIDAGQDRFVDEGSDVQYILNPLFVPSYVPDSNIVQLPRPAFVGVGAVPGTTATVDWDEGAGPEAAAVDFTSGVGLITGLHLYEEDGVFDVEFCITTPAPFNATLCDAVVMTVNNVAPTTSLFDLASWTQESYPTVGGFPAGEWIVAADRRSVFQSKNGEPTFFYSDFNVFESESSVRIRVSGGDDDMIGFALGFKPGDTTNQDADYILVDWKRGTQGFNFTGTTANCTVGTTATRGLAVSRVTGTPTADELWGHVDYTQANSSFSTAASCLAIEDAGVEELARASTLGSAPWTAGIEYTFDFVYTATQLKILVNGVEQFSLTGSFPDGRVGFYNFSQAGVTYSALGVAAAGAFEGDPVVVRGDYEDPGVQDTHTGTINWADGTALDSLIINPDTTTPGTGTLESPVHVFADNGSFITRACVADDDGGIGCKQVTINVSNLPPDVSASDDAIQAGQNATTNVSFTDPGSDDVHSAVIDWGDGSDPEDLGEVFSPFSPSHLYVIDGIYTVLVTVTDDDGGVGVAEAEITVDVADVNEVPIAVAGGPYEVEEGSTVPLSSAGSDDNDGFIQLYEWDLDGDSVFGETGAAAANGDETGPNPNFDATSLDGPGAVEVTLRVTDNGDAQSTASATVTINNVAPSATAGGDVIDEGQQATVSGTITDPGVPDSFTVTIDWGDGSSATVLNLPSGTTSYGSNHTYADDDPTGTPSDVYLVSVTVEDDDSGVGTADTTVTVNNVAPVVDAGTDASFVLGDPFSLASASFTDVGVADTHIAIIDWGDGNSEPGIVTGSGGSGTVAGVHTYSTGGIFTITVTLIDDDTGEASSQLEVSGEAPQPEPPVADAGGPYSVDEGGTVGLSGAGSSDSDGTIVLYEWDLDGDGIFGETGAPAANGDETGVSPVFDASSLSGPLSVTVTLRVTDDDDLSDTDTATVRVNDLTPPEPVEDSLGPPSIPIADGTKLIAAGTGLLTQPGTIEIFIPDGASIEQVLLYWEGQFTTGTAPDDDITVNGIDVTGVSIGGPKTFYGNTSSATFRADITGLGVISTGANSVEIAGLSNDKANNGAGIVVIIDDGSQAEVVLRDGNDLAFINFAPPLNSTVPQVFHIEPMQQARLATLSMFFSSVEGSASGSGSDRPTSIEITTGGVKTVLSNELASVDGDEWDTLNVEVVIPAGASSVTVQAFSRDDNGSRKLPASFAWNMVGITLPAEPVAEPPQLPAHWTFDDGTGTDSSGNGNHATVHGAVLADPRIGAGALDFDGINDYVDAGNVNLSANAVTLAAWFNSDDLANCGSSDCRIASMATGVQEQDHILMLSTIASGGQVRLRFRLKTGGVTRTLIAPTGNLSNGAWYHAAATYDGTRMRLYLNGVEVGSLAVTGLITTNPAVPLWIGGNPDSATSRPWDGKLDDVQLFPTALSLAEIQALASVAAPPPPAPSLLGHWTFDDGSGTDSSGNGNNGVVTGATQVAGQVGAGALEFDGVDDRVDVGNIDVPGNAITVAAWINADDLANCGSSDCRIASKATGIQEQDHYLMLSTIASGGQVRLRFRLKAGGTTQTLNATVGNLSNGQWYHVAATYDGSNMRLYVDGVEVGAVAKSGAISTNPAVPLWIGGNPDDPASRPWEGKIDDVRLYAGALSLAEIQGLATP